MENKDQKLYNELKAQGLSPEQEALIKRELSENSVHYIISEKKTGFSGLYEKTDLEILQNIKIQKQNPTVSLETLEELLERDKQREADGFPRRIRIGKLIKPARGNKSKIVVVPTTTEPKFYHDDSITEDDEQNTGGTGQEAEGEILGEQQAQPQQGEVEGEGAGEGDGSSHEVGSGAFDLGKVLTEKFELPNLKDKGKKPSLVKYQYDLTDINRGFGQVLDKKATLRKIIQTNILLGNVKPEGGFAPEDLLLSPQDHVYRILSKEKDYESQAIVFFVRDYSGSMDGKPTEVITTQHLFIYSWLMYQYQKNVETRFIVHDTEAKEISDFFEYFKVKVAGGTKVAPAFQLVNKIVEQEQLAKDYNIYIFYGTDGDDWDTTGKLLLDTIKESFRFVNRIGITVAKNSWSKNTTTTVERNIKNSGILKEHADLIRMDTMVADEASEERIIEGIKQLVS